MQNLTKEEAIKRHRLMWNWIAETTRTKKRCIGKEAAFKHFGWPMISARCWCCEYASNMDAYCGACYQCPIDWSVSGTRFCNDPTGFYRLWADAIVRNDYKIAARYAQYIADLPEKH